MNKNIIITGTGSYIPTTTITNKSFLKNKFYDARGDLFDSSNEEIIEKFRAITGIHERRYVSDDMISSDMGYEAARIAIEDAGVDKEDIDQIIVAQNFGDVKKGAVQSDMVPSLATRIKQRLEIENPSCVCYDVIFGCPGWIQGIIQAESFIKSGLAKRCLVVGTETLSRVVDVHDRDSMIYADGAGACIIEGVDSETKEGVLSTSMASYTSKEAYYLYLDKSNYEEADPNISYIKMNGHKVYEFALRQVPAAMKLCMDKAEIGINDISKIFIHQANEKMDFEIVKRFYRLYKIRQAPENILPMTIHELGNSSVGTVPTIFDLVRKNKINGHHLKKGDLILFTSIGAGMNVNCIAYKY
ncbi:MAG: 3-oxoacyl-ACP synthase [Bacteroidetes bacterium 4484_276]|nr:MAG: 3-oxoacyl-ACP synthase [Bacteroidetes bacterium 4484_276]OYT13363.1 MAG: 3-oxoacyl-ACP synthase [Bacteroidetes bacterium 4572_114]